MQFLVKFSLTTIDANGRRQRGTFPEMGNLSVRLEYQMDRASSIAPQHPLYYDGMIAQSNLHLTNVIFDTSSSMEAAYEELSGYARAPEETVWVMDLDNGTFIPLTRSNFTALLGMAVRSAKSINALQLVIASGQSSKDLAKIFAIEEARMIIDGIERFTMEMYLSIDQLAVDLHNVVASSPPMPKNSMSMDDQGRKLAFSTMPQFAELSKSINRRYNRVRCPIEKFKCAGAVGDLVDDWMEELIRKLEQMGGEAGDQVKAIRDWLAGPGMTMLKTKLRNALLPVLAKLGADQSELTATSDTSLSAGSPSSRSPNMATGASSSVPNISMSPLVNQMNSEMQKMNMEKQASQNSSTMVPIVPALASSSIPSHTLAPASDQPQSKDDQGFSMIKGVQLDSNGQICVSMAIYNDQVISPVVQDPSTLVQTAVLPDLPVTKKEIPEESLFIKSPKKSSSPQDDDEDWVVA